MKYLLALGLWVLLIVGLPAQTPDAVPANSLLWRISNPDNATASYLYGTIHMIPAEDYFLTEGTKTALAAADKVYFEIDMRSMNDPMALMPVMNRIMMNNDTTLEDLLTEAQYDSVAAHFESIGMPFFLLKRMKPMFLTAMVSEDMNPDGGFGSGEIKSYEMELMALAEADKKEIGGLETIEFQLGLFDAIPYRAQAQMLYEAIISEQTGGAASFDQMVEMYKAQDIEGMVQMMGEDGNLPGGLGGYEDILLDKRNASWIAPMREQMAEGPVFFAVGAGHLGGPRGVIALLREAGYTVEPVRD
jgi:uncharacterized protein YbaP (TraB family)